MDIVEEREESASEALVRAQNCWRGYYFDTERSRPGNFLLWDSETPSYGQMIWGAGSVINLFPNTHYGYDDFVCWHSSWEDGWQDDWYNVGADLYHALSNTSIELDVKSAERKAACSAIEP